MRDPPPVSFTAPARLESESVIVPFSPVTLVIGVELEEKVATPPPAMLNTADAVVEVSSFTFVVPVPEPVKV